MKEKWQNDFGSKPPCVQADMDYAAMPIVEAVPSELNYSAVRSYNTTTQLGINYIQDARPVEGIIGGPLGMVAGRQRIVIKQKFQAIEAALQTLVCNACEFKNIYDLYDFDTGEHLSHIKEDSGCCGRVCWSPYHKLTLNYEDRRIGVPPGTLAMRAEKPCSCCLWACCDCCRHEMTSFLPNGEKFGKSKVPVMGGGMTPTIEIMDRNGNVLNTVTGPTFCLGGCVELCKSIEFKYHKGGRNGQAIANIVKVKPSGLSNSLKEALSDSSDVYVLELPPDATPEEAAGMVSTALLMDYIYFESGPPLRYNPQGGCKVNLCNIYCYGCILPCSCKSGKNN